MKHAVEVHNLSKHFRLPHGAQSTIRGYFVNLFNRKSIEDFTALEDISFTVEKGEFFSLVGKNGSGKSTLLKLLAGIYTPDSGSVQVNGSLSPFLELGIGFNPELSGRDNIYLNGTILGLSRKELEEKYEEIVQFSELERFIDQKIKNYSSGMRVRLAFSVAIHANSDILLMDEVLAVGDDSFKEKCLSQFELMKSQGKTIIFVSHAANLVKKYSDRVLVLEKGHISYVGDPEEAIERYKHSA